ncbi:MAG: HAD-IIIC family phosphatase [Clostridiales Family XIII bacterium]|jgi:FkbH-like protein|nr:HAD-IIIC family phosphatase [Clostridiales Family XIII bacterium]
MADFKRLRVNLNKDYSAFHRMNIAVLADQASQYIAQALRAVSFERLIDARVYEGAFDRMLEEALDPDSGLYLSEPDRIVVFPSAQNYRARFYNEEKMRRATFPEREAARLCDILDALTGRSGAPVIICNFCTMDDGLYGNLAGTYPESLLSGIRETNMLIAESVKHRDGVFLVDVDMLQSAVGAIHAYDPRSYYLASCPWTMDFLADVADRVFAVSDALTGKVRKCLITDLDDTLWGGVVGEVGWEHIAIGGAGVGRAYADLQAWIRELSRRGIAVCVCSKNDERVAMMPFLQHPDMVLRRDDIAVFIANWRDKASNIREIRRILNIGFDSMVFIDDNPFERELVRNALPDVVVPELPRDATGVLSYLQSLGLFEAVVILEEDVARTEMYRHEAERERHRERAANLDTYLKELDMRCTIGPFDAFSIPRAAQLTQRTNQFNLRTRRYTERELADMTESGEYVTMCASLRDAFGDYGIIGVAILRKDSPETLFLDTFLMSCRVAKRGVETFMIGVIASEAKRDNYREIIAEYIPTAKNGPAKGLLREMGFVEQDISDEPDDVGDTVDGPATRWRLALDSFVPQKTYIEAEMPMIGGK